MWGGMSAQEHIRIAQLQSPPVQETNAGSSNAGGMPAQQYYAQGRRMHAVMSSLETSAAPGSTHTFNCQKAPAVGSGSHTRCAAAQAEATSPYYVKCCRSDQGACAVPACCCWRCCLRTTNKCGSCVSASANSVLSYGMVLQQDKRHKKGLLITPCCLFSTTARCS
jgi:hypothetical protein